MFRTVARSGVAGVAATASDLATLTLLVEVFHVGAHAANVPALLVGAVVNFVGNRYAFRAADSDAAKQAVGYSLVEAVALGLNGALYEVVLRLLPQAAAHMFWLVRLVVSCAVFLGWSYPLWRRVFRVPQPERQTSQ